MKPVSVFRRASHSGWAGLALLVLTACKSDPPVVGANRGAVASASAARPPPIDRLAPGELAPGKTVVLGLVLPEQLRVDAQFPRTVHATGRVSPEALANYLRKRVVVGHVELGDTRMIFPRVQIPDGPKDKWFRMEIVEAPGGYTRLVITDLTRPAAPEGITEEERWRRAGLTPDGKIANMKELE